MLWCFGQLQLLLMLMCPKHTCRIVQKPYSICSFFVWPAICQIAGLWGQYCVRGQLSAALHDVILVFFLAAVAAALAWAADDMHTILYLLLALSVPMHRVFYCQNSFFWKMCKLWLSTLTDNSFFYFDYVLLVVYSDKTCSCKIKVNQKLLTLCLLGCVWNCSRRPMQCATLSLVTVIEIGTKIAVFFSRKTETMVLCLSVDSFGNRALVSRLCVQR